MWERSDDFCLVLELFSQWFLHCKEEKEEKRKEEKNRKKKTVFSLGENRGGHEQESLCAKS